MRVRKFIICHLPKRNSMIEIKEIRSKQQFKGFIKFPFQLYKDHPHWVPALIKEECDNFDPKINPVFEYAEARYFMAFKSGKPVGRIAVIVNHTEVEQQGKLKLRFGWFDVIDDLLVSRTLLEKAMQIAREKKLEWIEGPVGFSNMDKAGLLVEGFEEKNTLISWYNYPYYAEHFQKLGFEMATEWVEFKLKIPQKPLERVKRFADLILYKFNLNAYRFKSKKDVLDHADEMFELLNKTYSKLSTYVPFEKKQIDYYKRKYFPYLHPDFIISIKDQTGKMVAFAIMMPSLSDALKKANGSLWPLGWFYLWKANTFPKMAEFYLIGIESEFQNKGLTAIILHEVNELFLEKGIKHGETNPELADNKAIQAMWKNYEGYMHKRRQTFKKSV